MNGDFGSIFTVQTDYKEETDISPISGLGQHIPVVIAAPLTFHRHAGNGTAVIWYPASY
jgi:hypothetical protein